MLLDVLAIVGYAARSNAGLSHQLKTDLPTQVIWDLSLLHNSQSNTLMLNIQLFRPMFEMICPYLPLFIYLREKLVHVHQIFILQEQHRAQEMTSLHQTHGSDVCVFKCVSHVFGFALADLSSVLTVL